MDLIRTVVFLAVLVAMMVGIAYAIRYFYDRRKKKLSPNVVPVNKDRI